LLAQRPVWSSVTPAAHRSDPPDAEPNGFSNPKGPTLANYRIYLLTTADRIDDFRIATCVSDAEAASAAKRLLRDHLLAEIWCGGRLVGRVSRATAEADLPVECDGHLIPPRRR
jgi:hypothetical protein